MEQTPIQKFYEGKSIFLTGATGFVGKVLLEKLLRCCPGIVCIYILLREKKGKTTDQRLDDIFTSELFKVLKKENRDFRKKVSIVNGDLNSPTLDITEHDHKKLRNEVNIVFHTAGRVKWDDELKIYAQVHMIASRVLMEMAKGFINIEAFIHVSTAGVHRDADFTVPTHVPKKHISPKQFLDALEWMDNETEKAIAPLITLKYDLTSYTLSKALTENILEESHGHVPLAIVRPVYIMPTYKDPFPGFCEAYQGAQNILLGLGKGVIKVGYIHPNFRFNMIPVDVTANTLICTAWHVALTEKKKDALVVNCSMEYENHPLVDESLAEMYLKTIRKYPFANIIRYPDVTVYRSFFWFRVHHFFAHYIYVIPIDILLFIFTGKPRMMDFYNQVYKLFIDIYITICKNPFICKLDTYNAIRDQLNHGDEKDWQQCCLLFTIESNVERSFRIKYQQKLIFQLFYMDTSDFDFEKHLEDVILVMRKLLGKEDLSNLTYARRKLMVWWCVTTALKWAFIIYVLYYIYSLILN